MKYSVDVLIAGTGVAGLYCALNLKRDLRVLVISKSELRNTNTYLAQGGISTARNIEDIPLFVEDTIKAGGYENKIEAVKVLAQESIENINDLIKFGLELDKSDSNLSYTREGAHSINRIVHSKDQTGKAVAETLIKEAKKRDNIELWEYTTLVDILKKDNKCVGGILLKDNEPIEVSAEAVVIATGGIGGLFNDSTNQRELTGDGISIAIKNGIKLKNIDYIQFHPTGFYNGENNDRRFLISESLRGEGAKLINLKGETSCTGVHDRNRLASNSLLEGLVFSKRAAQVINNTVNNININNLISSSYTLALDKDLFEKEN